MNNTQKVLKNKHICEQATIRYNNFRKLKSKQKKTWFAALW